MLSSKEQSQLVKLLAKLEPGFLPYEIFKQIARLTVLSIMEFVPLRVKDSDIEVLLIERSKDDDIWPGELHTPGTVIRPTDTTGDIYKAFERILKDELKETEVSEGHFVGTNLHESKRGMEHAQVFWVEVKGKEKVGKFYKANDLPSNFMESQKKFVQQAVKDFAKQKGLEY